MKKSLVLALAGVLCLVSCAVKETESPYAGFVYDVFQAAIEQAEDRPESGTKVYADDNFRVLWNAGDRISIFNFTTFNSEYLFDGADGDNAGSFSKVDDGSFVTGNQISAIYSVYPYSSETKISNDEVLTLTLPAVQTWAEGTFGPGSNTMVSAGTDNNLLFRNAGGVLVFKLYGAGASVKSLRLRGNNGELLAGPAEVSMPVGEVPSLSVIPQSGNGEVSLVADGAVSLCADADNYIEFWFVLPPVNFSKGFTLTVTGSDGGTFEKATTNEISILRNHISRMAPIEVNLSTTGQPDNEIWYTSADGNIVEPYDVSSIDATIVSNTYIDGKGVIAFDKAITNVGEGAFRYCRNLETVLLPESVKSIGYFAFDHCSALSEVYIPQAVDYIGRFAFGYTSLVSVTLPDSYEYPADAMNIFNGCSRLESFYGGYASEDHRCLIVDDELRSFAPAGLTEYTIPEGVKSITNYTFSYFYNLQKVTLPSTLQSMNHSAFYFCTGLKSLEIPESMVSLTPGAIVGCYSIGSFSGKFATKDGRCLIDGEALVAFAPYGISSYDIPEGVSSIGTLAFFYASLQSVTLPSTLTVIGQEAFEKSGLTCDLVIPESVASIEIACFSGCNLNSLTILAQTPPSGEKWMFSSNYTIYVPATSVEAYKSAPYWSDYADRIQAVPDGPQPDNEIWYTSTDGQIVSPKVDNCFGATLVENTYIAGKGVMRFDGAVTMIGDETVNTSSDAPFGGVNKLRSISLPESVEKICFFAFGNCRNLREIVLPQHLEYCGGMILYGTAVESLRFPETTNLTGGNPVYYAPMLSSFTGPYASSDGRCLIKDNELVSFAPADLVAYTVPEGVKRIGSRAFSDCANLASVQFPHGLEIIGVQSFVDCKSLSSLFIPETVKELKVSAFHGCTSLTTVHIPSATYVSSGVFDNCTSLSSFTGRYASEDGRCLIDSGRIIAFAPAGLRSYSIPSGVDDIAYGFDGLIELESLTLPSSVRYISFISGTSLKLIYCNAQEPPVVSYSWSFSFPKIEAIYVPAESVDAYKSAPYWSDYADRIQAVPAP